MEFESDDDVDEQTKNSSIVKTEGKVRVKKKITHYYEFSSDEEEEKRAAWKTLRKPRKATKIKSKMMKMIRLLCQMKGHCPALEKTFFLETQQPQAT